MSGTARIRGMGMLVVSAFVLLALIAIVQHVAAQTTGEQVCPGLDSGKIDVGDNVAIQEVRAPEGFLIDEYCVKAGSAQQGDGPEFVAVDPPQPSLVIEHSTGKDISHYSVSYVPIEEVYPPETTTGGTTAGGTIPEETVPIVSPEDFSLEFACESGTVTLTNSSSFVATVHINGEPLEVAPGVTFIDDASDGELLEEYILTVNGVVADSVVPGEECDLSGLPEETNGGTTDTGTAGTTGPSTGSTTTANTTVPGGTTSTTGGGTTVNGTTEVPSGGTTVVGGTTTAGTTSSTDDEPRTDAGNGTTSGGGDDVPPTSIGDAPRDRVPASTPEDSGTGTQQYGTGPVPGPDGVPALPSTGGVPIPIVVGALLIMAGLLIKRFHG